MKLTVAAILAVLGWLTQDNQGETEAERIERLEPTAVAIHELAKSRREVAFLLTQGRFESRFAENIQRGECRPGTCDPNSYGVPKAHGFFQAHKLKRPDLAALWARSKTDVRAMVELQLIMQRELFSCGGNVVHSFSAHDGRGCRDTVRGRHRAKFMQRVSARLRKEMGE